ncbi:DUF1573 domain-containing protein [Flavobacteriaceae bacterium F08102]|nr:DUF1573 domain-containing protein [Flavobacteriaceae bacterium F08102]
MKRLVYVSVIALISLSSCKDNIASKINAENVQSAKERDFKINNEAAALTFENTVYDFGTVNEGDIVETTFKFKNTGKSNLIITNATSTCGCTVPEWPKEPIPVNGTGMIKVKFNTSGKPNTQRKVVTLTTNTKNGKETVEVKGTVTPKSNS